MYFFTPGCFSSNALLNGWNFPFTLDFNLLIYAFSFSNTVPYIKGTSIPIKLQFFRKYTRDIANVQVHFSIVYKLYLKSKHFERRS